MTDPEKPAAPVVDAPAYGMNGVGMYGDGLDPVTGGFAHLLIGGKRVDKATILAALAQQPRTEPAGEAEREAIIAACAKRRKERFPGGGRTTAGAALLGAFDWGVLAALDAMAALSRPRPEQVEDEAVADKIIALGHRWAKAAYDRALGRDFEPYEPIQREMRALAHPAPKPAADVPAGWKLVPIAPTMEMVNAAFHSRTSVLADDNTIATWRDMLAAAPTPANAATEKEGGINVG